MIFNYIPVMSTISDQYLWMKTQRAFSVNRPMDDVYLMLCHQILSNVLVPMLLDITAAKINETSGAPEDRC